MLIGCFTGLYDTMRVKDMHPLCCISLEDGAYNSPAAACASPEIALSRMGSLKACPSLPRSDAGRGSDFSVAGPLFKWTNYGKGWRSRWFLLRSDGHLSYCKILSHQNLSSLLSTLADDVGIIGSVKSPRLYRMDSCGRRKHSKGNNSTVHLKVSSFRESRSDGRRFYIFTATKTLHLRTATKQDRQLWIEALASTRSLFSLRSWSASPGSLSISTERLKSRLAEEGVSESLVKDCEQIMLSEFSKIQGQLNSLCEERSNLLDTLRQLEAANIEAEAAGVSDSEFRVAKNEYSGLARTKYSEYSTAESSEDGEKQDVEAASDEEASCYYDTNDYLAESPSHCVSKKGTLDNFGNFMDIKNITGDTKELFPETTNIHIERRKKLPNPIEKEKAVSLWSMIKDNVGKDLTRVCLPVYFNEPLSSLQKCCEDLEYSYLLDQAYEYGKAGDSLMRIVNVAAFAVSGYASSEGRLCKPFNPLLGETYEADYPERGFRFFSEKVSHHPTLIACHCEGRGWKFWADSNLKTKFWGQSIQLDPVGLLTLEFDDGERFQWSKVTTSIYNLVIGKIYCDHHGTMQIRGNRQYSCNLKFKGQSFFDRNPRLVQGFVEDAAGCKVATVFGKWDESIYYTEGDGTKKIKDPHSSGDAHLLWKRIKPTPNLTRYNLTSFAITLNELTPGLKGRLPPTDSRLRPDQRSLENGEYEKANAEKLRLEKRQRMSRKLQEDGWKPRWFERQGDNGPYIYKGGYWEAREQGNWDGCANIFGEFREDPLAIEES